MEDWKLQPAADIGLPIGKRMLSVRREPGLIESIGHLAYWSAIRAYLKIFHRLKVEGLENLPEHGPFVLAANHSSHLDALVLATAMSWQMRDSVFPIAAGDTFFETSLTAVLSAVLMNALPMWRKKTGPHALTELRTRLIEESCIYIIFPEGTRTRTGEINSFKAGLGMIVAGTTVPIVPCRLWGTFEALPVTRRWPMPKRVKLKIGAPVKFDQTTNDRPGWQKLAATLEQLVRNL